VETKKAIQSSVIYRKTTSQSFNNGRSYKRNGREQISNNRSTSKTHL